MGACACPPCRGDTEHGVTGGKLVLDLIDVDDGQPGSSAPETPQLDRHQTNALINGLDPKLKGEDLGREQSLDRCYSIKVTNVDSTEGPRSLISSLPMADVDPPSECCSRTGSKVSVRHSWAQVQDAGGAGGRRGLQDAAGLRARLMGGLGDSSVDTADVLKEVEYLVDVEYDILLAEMLLEELKARISAESWNEIAASKLCQRFRRKFDYLAQVGRACGSPSRDWFNVYKDAAGTSSIYAFIDKADPQVVHYRVKAVIPARLTNAMAVANEVQLMPKWNPVLEDVPKVVGRRTAHYLVMNYHITLLRGMYKLDLLNEIRRFSDAKGGYLAEYIRTVEPGHPCYKEPLPGYRRPKQELKNVWVACGDDHCVLVQVGKLTLPFAPSQWLASNIGGLAGRFVVGGLVKNSSLSQTPGNPWEKLLERDEMGYYARLNELVASEASRSRAPSKAGEPPAFTEADLAPFFERERLYNSMPGGDGSPGKAQVAGGA